MVADGAVVVAAAAAIAAVTPAARRPAHPAGDDRSERMSVPRTAIERPVTMFMISAVVTMLGAISLFRLPVDLLPDVTYPTITVRVGYGGVGPAEIEQLIVRPLEQTLAAVPGLDQ